MSKSALAEIYFIVAMMIVILIICAAAVFFFFRQYKIEKKNKTKVLEEKTPEKTYVEK